MFCFAQAYYWGKGEKYPALITGPRAAHFLQHLEAEKKVRLSPELTV